jgi:hypothetical protein
MVAVIINARLKKSALVDARNNKMKMIKSLFPLSTDSKLAPLKIVTNSQIEGDLIRR